jgi:hypothetical protein
VLGGEQVIELVEPHLLLERRLVREAVQQHGQPPRHARGAPHPTQRGIGIAIEVMGLRAKSGFIWEIPIKLSIAFLCYTP